MQRSWVQILYKPEFFSGLIFTTAQVVYITARITFIFMSLSTTSNIWLSYILSHLYIPMLGCKGLTLLKTEFCFEFISRAKRKCKALYRYTQGKRSSAVTRGHWRFVLLWICFRWGCFSSFLTSWQRIVVNHNREEISNEIDIGFIILFSHRWSSSAGLYWSLGRRRLLASHSQSLPLGSFEL